MSKQCTVTLISIPAKGGGHEKTSFDLIAPRCCYSSVEHIIKILEPTTGFKTGARSLPKLSFQFEFLFLGVPVHE